MSGGKGRKALFGIWIESPRIYHSLQKRYQCCSAIWHSQGVLKLNGKTRRYLLCGYFLAWAKLGGDSECIFVTLEAYTLGSLKDYEFLIAHST